MKQWVPTKSSFDRFLEGLDPDRDRAGQKYEALRIKVIKFFEWRACASAEDLADETIDRVIRKIDAGELVRDHAAYTYRVAKFLYLEKVKVPSREQALEDDFAAPFSEIETDDTRLADLERCLGMLSQANREMVLRYYQEDKRAKIDHRKKLADSLGLSLNALRIKTNRIRAKLEECVIKSRTEKRVLK